MAAPGPRAAAATFNRAISLLPRHTVTPVISTIIQARICGTLHAGINVASVVAPVSSEERSGCPVVSYADLYQAALTKNRHR
jgi:hypothetical protein